MILSGKLILQINMLHQDQAQRKGINYLYAQQMQFLLNTFEAAETASNITGHNCDEQDDSEIQPPPKIERKSKKPKSVDLQIIDYLNKSDEANQTKQVYFFRSLLSSVKDFTEDEKLELKGGVISLISNIRKARNNYPHINASQTSGAPTYYSYNVPNTTAAQVQPTQGPSLGQLQQMQSPSYAQLQPMQSPCNPDSNPPSVSSVSSHSSIIDILGNC